MEEWWNQRYRDEGLIWDKIPSDCAQRSIGLFRKHNVLRILDIPCGYGRDSIFLHKQGFSVSATDFSKHALEMFKECMREDGCSIDIHHKPAEELHFDDGSFDAILSNRFINLLYHDEQREKVVNEMHRVLKDGGLLCLSTRCSGDPEEKNAINKEGKTSEIPDRPGHKVRFDSEEEIERLLSDKFEIIELEQTSEPVTAERKVHCPLIYISARKRVS